MDNRRRPERDPNYARAPMDESRSGELLARARSGDSAARSALIAGLAPLVREVTRQIKKKHCGIDPRDLYQSGCIGLMEALEEYDPSSAIPLRDFARRRIWRAEMQALFSEYRRGAVLPRIERQCLLGVARVYKRLCQQLGRQPSLQELSGAPGLPAELVRGSPERVRERLKRILLVIGGPAELDAPRTGGLTLQQALKVEGPETRVEREEIQAERRKALMRALAVLSPQQRVVFQAAILSDKPGEDGAGAAGDLQLAPRQVWRARQRGMARLRRLRWLKDYM